MTTGAYVEELTPEVCRALLASRDVGRIGFVGDDGFPVVFPVNYVVDGDTILVRTTRGETAEHAPFHKVSFEVDHFDEATHTGWSLLVQGLAHDVTGAMDESRQTMLRRVPTVWAPGERNVSISIGINRIGGRQIVRT